MRRDRYAPMNLFDLVPALSLALDPVLPQLDRALDDETLFQAVKADLAHRFPRTPLDGRPSTSVEILLRMLVIKHLYGWSDEATERSASDSLVLRQCCRVYVARVPDDTTLLLRAHLIQPATLHRVLDHVVGLARSVQVTHGRELRLDGTVVDTHIHHPTDSTLLYYVWRAGSVPNGVQSQESAPGNSCPGPPYLSTSRVQSQASVGPFHPLADGALADNHGLGNLALRPALRLEVLGVQAARFFPGMKCRVHAG
jgi:Transposase domain (DUF772)